MLRQDAKYLNPSDFATFSMFVIIAGLILSPFLLSVGMWLLAMAAIWHQFLNTAFERWNNMVPMPRLFWFACKRIWRNYKAQPIFWLLSLLFLVPALSGIWSEEHAFWLTNTRVRIPFVTLPLTFASLPSFNYRQKRVIIAFFLVLMTVVCLGVGINFMLHRAEIMELLRIGKPIPVPRSHIRFSLAIALAVLTGLYSLRQMSQHAFGLTECSASKSYSGLSKLTMGIVTCFLFAFLHFLSVRSGILAVYLGLFVYLVAIAIQSKKYWLIPAGVGVVVLSGWLALQFMPSLAMKLSYMRWDMTQYAIGEGAIYSDSGRMASIEAGWKLVKQYPILGIGTGDLHKEVERVTLAAHPEFVGQVKLPHNQWLFILTSTGVLGLLASLFATFYWLSVKRLRTNALFLGFQAIALSSLLVEYTFETSIGAAFYLVTYCFMVVLFLRQASDLAVQDDF